MNLLPRKPSLTTWGAYDTIDLARYLEEAAVGGMSNLEIARHLGVDMHRIIYLTSKDGQRTQGRRMQMLAECRS
jgi:hypothetical protein